MISRIKEKSVMTTMTTVTKMPMTIAMIMLNGVEPMIMLSGS